MATALASGCDFAGSWGTEGADIAAFVYAGTASGGSTGPAPGTTMSFVGRYIGSGYGGGGASSSFAITPSELSSLRSNGLSVFFFYESNLIQPSVHPTTYLSNTTYAQGVRDAQDAQQYLSSVLGISTANMPVYFVIDYDSGITELPSLVNYFSGVSSIMGANNTGLYGNGTLWANVGTGTFPQLANYFCQTRSTGWSGNGSFVTGQTLWQWPPGYTPSGSPTINGHTVDGEFAYTADFGQYPRSAPTTFGTETAGTATVGLITYAQSEPTTIIVPDNGYDQVLWSRTGGTLSIPNITNYTAQITIVDTGLGQAAFPIGNFTYGDSTVGYADMGFMPAPSSPGQPLFGKFYGPLPVVVIQPIVDVNGILYFDVAVQQTFSVDPNLNITYNIALLAQGNAKTVPHNADTPGVVAQAIGYSNINVSPNKVSNFAAYRRISEDINVGSSGSHTLPHNLGTVPNILFWNYLGGNSFINSSRWTNNGHFSGYYGIAMDSDNVYVYVDSPDITGSFIRVYRDN